MDKAIKELKKQLSDMDKVVSAQRNKITSFDPQINEIQEEINKIEDGVFVEFCVKHGLPNIRKFDENQLFPNHQTRQEKRCDIETQIHRINCFLKLQENMSIQSTYIEFISILNVDTFNCF